MNYSTCFTLALSTLQLAQLHEASRELLHRHAPSIGAELFSFFSQPCTPTAMLDLEQRLSVLLREIGRDVMEYACNNLEEGHPDELPSHVRFDGEDYRIVKEKTPRDIDTLFGPIRLWRHLYRPACKASPEKSFAPLERMLGVRQATTPALAEAAARHAAEAGSTQRRVQDQLLSRHGVTIGVERLRSLLLDVSSAMDEVRQQTQVERLLDLLKQADASSGRYKPSLIVSRDGITMREHEHSLYEVATTGTVTVSDRAGKRLGTVYLAYAPELGQHQMTDQLTALLEETLRKWEGSLPRLAYITDAGDNETAYFDRVLHPMVHPRTGEKLKWHRILDFYHAMERVWKLADVLFADDRRGRWAWGRKMGKLLKKSNGPFRVLHSAAALRAKRRLSQEAQKEYEKHYNYLRSRTRSMRYADYARVKLPLGSGVVEAACKTIYTQTAEVVGHEMVEDRRPGDSGSTGGPLERSLGRRLSRDVEAKDWHGNPNSDARTRNPAFKWPDKKRTKEIAPVLACIFIMVR